jgi:serine/threonine protein kinase
MRCCLVNRHSGETMKTKSSMLFSKMSLFTPSPCLEMQSRFSSVYVLHRYSLARLLTIQLLTRDPTRRLGAGEADAEDIKRHLFFKDVNFDDVYHKRIPPPYFPTIKGATDTSNFDQEFTREQPTLTPVHTQLSAADQQEFAGFSWIAPWAHQN